MAKTRSQTRNIVVKKEEEEDCKPTLRLNGVENTKGNNKITKRKPTKSNTRNLSAQQVKVEEETDTKLLLQSGSKSSKLPKGQRFSQEQINQLIGYLVNDKMSITKAARKVKLSRTTAYDYYNLYKNDPDKKIPVPRNQFMCLHRSNTLKQIENLIRYIVDDKMPVKQASEKANISHKSGYHYYKKYLQDPDHKIPIPRSCQYTTQDQKNEFIGYIVNDKMNIKEASEKAKMARATGKDISTEQKKQFISCVIDGKMTTAASARKANMHRKSATNYYRRYLKDNNMALTVPKNTKPYTPDKINEFIGYIVNDKMSIKAATKKANMSKSSGYHHYGQYLKDQKR